jgi:hypothetical protein
MGSTEVRSARPPAGRAGGRGLLEAARLLIALVVAAGVGCLAVRLPEVTRWSGGDLLACLALAAGTAIVEQFLVRLPHRAESEDFSLTDALWTSGLLLARPGVLTVSVAIGVVAGQAARRTAPLKVAFNAGQLIVSLTAAEVLVAVLRHGGPVGGAALGAGVAGMAVFFVLNTSLLALVISLVEEERFLDTLLSPVFLNVVHWAGNLGAGLLGAWLWDAHPWAAPVLVVPMAMAYLAYRAWMAGFLGRRRAAGFETGVPPS